MESNQLFANLCALALDELDVPRAFLPVVLQHHVHGHQLRHHPLVLAERARLPQEGPERAPQLSLRGDGYLLKIENALVLFLTKVHGLTVLTL